MANNKIFQHVANKRVKKNKFDLSRERKTSMKMGDLVPCFLQEVVPGDSFNVNAESLVRMAPLQSPMMHRVDCRMDYFFVPNRLVWNEWEDFITGGDDGLELPSFPRIPMAGSYTSGSNFAVGSLADHLGLPVFNGSSPATEVSALPFRAYQLIYNEYYRDQNLQDKIDFAIGSGIVPITEANKIQAMRKKCWEKDYFTSALPDTQKGPEVILPLGDTADVDFVPDGTLTRATLVTGSTPIGIDGIKHDSGIVQTDAGTAINIDNSDQLQVDLRTAVGANVNDLRRANALQRWLELLMRGGSRYKEMIFNFFGEHSRDARLDRPEYLGGGKKPVVISEVLQTYKSSANPADEPVGEMYGHGISSGSGYGFSNKKFTEHGYIIGIMNVLPRTAYSQGIHRTWFKFDKFDHYFPQFANLGEQEVLNKELYLENSGSPNEVFGYQQRYAEYKYACDSVHGEFRDTLDYWHMGRKFTSQPVLDDSFVESSPTNRVFQVIDPQDDKLWCQIYHNVQAYRPIPYHSLPHLS